MEGAPRASDKHSLKKESWFIYDKDVVLIDLKNSYFSFYLFILIYTFMMYGRLRFEIKIPHPIISTIIYLNHHINYPYIYLTYTASLNPKGRQKREKVLDEFLHSIFFIIIYIHIYYIICAWMYIYTYIYYIKQ